ncbi:MAG: hypothetical protein KKC11_05210 [Candidatus Omnitrophica bacterium]|nr:hypothetical protein [Candidatus Omnitrophota bacterium]MBU0878105.1 hypothetical protein [Candidatus Omnitrophota bacterium]MBU1133492.1 hypothetical protein [Candidatus Omnitrophota bacterium]MBU1809672.1 hypothetical protein [Candidatus Omnitrophota bacterium]MBU2504472.1 hypothetical protein [Candidatus Omnitrophota bacterium]
MTLIKKMVKKERRINKAQATIEYAIISAIVAASFLIVMGQLAPEKLDITQKMRNSLNIIIEKVRK